MAFRLGALAHEFPAAAVYCAAGCEERRCGCDKSLLPVVQRLAVFDDSKTFVDLPVLPERTAESVLDYWDAEFGRIVQTEELEVREDGTVAPRDDGDDGGDGAPVERVVRDAGDGGPITDFDEVRRFVMENFEFSPGSDAIPCAPADAPSGAEAAHASRFGRVLAALPDELREWARELATRWARLCRRTSPVVLAEPHRFSALPLRHPFVIAGGRFRECYYWDTYFIVRGLLACGMWRTARGCVDNLLDLVERFGFVPNGARIYFLNRSQPPMLSEMVCEIVRDADAAVGRGEADAADARAFARRALPLLEREYAFFMSHRAVTLGSRGARGSSGSLGAGAGAGAAATLNRYDAPLATGPRPESYREDSELVEELQVTVPGDPRRERLFTALTAGAESGWDFSSRWFADGRSLRTLRTPLVVPVCLNSILLRYESNLAWLYRRVAHDGQQGADAPTGISDATHSDASKASADGGDGSDDDGDDMARAYDRMAGERADAMQRFMYNVHEAQWFDFDLEWNAPVDRTPTARWRRVCASNFFPLWAGILEQVPPDGAAPGAARGAGRLGAESRAEVAARAVRALGDSGLVGAGGVAATLVGDSGQQWDYPNAWPPVQLMLFEGLGRAVRALAPHRDAGGNDGGGTGADTGEGRRDYGACHAEAQALQRRIGVSVVRSMYRGWRQSGDMHEKYDARAPGERGVGGEYAPQVGFGWSNGVALALMEELAPTLRVDEHGDIVDGDSGSDGDGSAGDDGGTAAHDTRSAHG